MYLFDPFSLKLLNMCQFMPYSWPNVNKLRIWQPPENFICVCVCVCVFYADSCNPIYGTGYVHCACVFCKYLVRAIP